jgi:hypothetical protein
MTIDPREEQLNVEEALIKKVLDLEKKIENLESGEFVTMRIKTTTGDFADGNTGQFVNNTVDNNLKAWLEGAWRTIISY